MAQGAFGNRRAWGLCNVSHSARLDIVAEGLPIILDSAEGFRAAAIMLDEQGHRREASVLDGFALEEAAKVLILVDLARCPRRLAGKRCGSIVRTFYGHLGRLIYADAQAWRPSTVKELRTYVDSARKSHGLEGYVGEYIVPNWSTYFRESALYADIESDEHGALSWNRPAALASAWSRFEPPVLLLARALRDLGLFKRASLEIVSEEWSALDFVDGEGAEEATRLTRAVLERMLAAGLVPDTATDDQAQLLLHRWQLPMYDLDFRELEVPLETLAAEREAALWAEAGYGPGDY